MRYAQKTENTGFFSNVATVLPSPGPTRRQGSSVVKQAIELRYAVRFRVVFKYFGQLCLVLAALTLAPLVMSVIFGDTPISLRLGIVIGGLAALGAGLARLRAPSRVQANEGMVLVALMLLFTPLVMSYPMMSSGLGFLDAFFEAVSGVTTTGLSTKATLVGAPSTFLFARAWMQWYGGLGIVVLSLAFVMQPGLVAKSLTVTETETDDLVGGTRAHARRVLKVYGVLTALGIIGSLSVGVGFFDAVLYTFAAVSTGSFAPQDGSLATLGWPAQVWITLLCLAGAIPLTFYHRMLREKRSVSVDFLQLQAVVIASLVVSLAVGAVMRLSAGMAWPQVLHHAPLLAFSAQTTSGFSSMPCAATRRGLEAGPDLLDACGRGHRIDRGRIQAVAAVDRSERVSVDPPADLPAETRRHRAPAGRPPTA